ncbi:MAG: type II toxin-antitoxin system RelE/ParE family toxin [Acidobacteria bacterium]|nr:type II toxin-antitoxin system RelE/ParE family toxin [Acidobacteriota bacterium]MDA1237170.1 type II toxin-antitoxin system RelE/ParE family toxin [Acidobacteriota bacterium]
MTKIRRFRLEVTQAASQDMAAIATWSSKEFGAAAALRYETLIFQALRDIESDPSRLGVRSPAELAHPVHTYHLQFSSHRVPHHEFVRRPRHYFVYRIKDNIVEILRLIHDAQDLERHVPGES